MEKVYIIANIAMMELKKKRNKMIKHIIVAAILLTACERIQEQQCRSGVAVPRHDNLPIHCDYRSKSFPLSDGYILCLCPQDVSRITQ